MAKRLGSHSARLTAVRELRSAKGRREQQRFAFEGPTMLAEAIRAGFPISELYATQTVYETTPLLAEVEASGTPVFVIGETAASRISDVTTPTGIVAVAPMRLLAPEAVFDAGSPILVLGDLNDPGNVGTLLRSADAFGTAGVLFGPLGIDPYNPKVVRGSMGAIFRLCVGSAEPGEIAVAARRAGARMLGLAVQGASIAGETWEPPLALVVGHERRGLGRWERVCDAILWIPIHGRAESLSAAVAGSIALYQASRIKACQESVSGQKSQDYRCQKSHGILSQR